MRNVERLILKAKRKYGACQMLFAIISQSEEKLGEWEANVDIRDGRANGKIRRKKLLFDSEEEAVRSVEELSSEYQIKNDIVIIIDDVVE